MDICVVFKNIIFDLKFQTQPNYHMEKIVLSSDIQEMFNATIKETKGKLWKSVT